MLRKAFSRDTAVRGLLLLCPAILAVACGGDGPAEPVLAEASMSFTYTGAETGTFSVAGIRAPGRDGVAALRFSGPPSLLVVGGARMRSETRADALDLVLTEVTSPRSFSLGDSSCVGLCPHGMFVIDGPFPSTILASDGEAVKHFVFSSGTVSVTHVSATRIAGTFSGTAESLTLGEPPRVITITNGRFDVPITSLGGPN